MLQVSKGSSGPLLFLSFGEGERDGDVRAADRGGRGRAPRGNRTGRGQVLGGAIAFHIFGQGGRAGGSRVLLANRLRRRARGRGRGLRWPHRGLVARHRAPADEAGALPALRRTRGQGPYLRAPGRAPELHGRHRQDGRRRLRPKTLRGSGGGTAVRFRDPREPQGGYIQVNTALLSALHEI